MGLCYVWGGVLCSVGGIDGPMYDTYTKNVHICEHIRFRSLSYLRRLLVRARIGNIRGRQGLNDTQERVGHEQGGIGRHFAAARRLEFLLEGGNEPRGDDFELGVCLLVFVLID